LRKLIWGTVVGVLLALPAAAGAQVLPGATYSGLFTTGTGGTVELGVSGDGATVEFNMGLFGQEGCAGNSLANARPIKGGFFDLFVPGPPTLIDVQGSFDGIGTASGSARIAGVCDSGAQSWTAETPVVWPDGLVEHAATGSAGDGIYNLTAVGQVRNWTVNPGRVGRFAVHVGNDGTEADDIDVAGCGSSKAFKVKYTQGGENVTSLVKSGNYETAALDTDESETLKLAITASKKAKRGKKKSCKVTMSHSGVFRGAIAPRTDAVKAVVKVR
jgi:hypothetical protein